MLFFSLSVVFFFFNFFLKFSGTLKMFLFSVQGNFYIILSSYVDAIIQEFNLDISSYVSITLLCQLCSYMVCIPPPPPSSLGVGRLKFLEKSLLGGGCKTFILVEEGQFCWRGRGSHNFEVKIKIAKYQYKEYFWNN